MIFRALVYVAYALTLLNLSLVFRVPAANVVEKGSLMLMAAVALVARPADRFILVLLGVNYAMFVVLGAATDYTGFSWRIFLNSLNQVFIIYALLSAKLSERDASAYLTAAAWAPLAATVLGMAYQTVGLWPLFAREFTTGLYRFQGSLIPAYMAGFAMCGSFAALQLGLGRSSNYLLLFLVNMFLLFLSGGRTTLAATLFVCATSLYLRPDVPGRLKAAVTVVGAVVGTVIVAALWDRIVTRFTGSGTSGRDIMWPYLKGLAEQYPWTGIGFGHQYFATPDDIKIKFGSYAAHNDYYRLAVELGYVGVGAFYFLLTTAVLKVWFSARGARDVTILAAFVGYLVVSITDNALATPAYFPILILAIFTAVRPARSRPAEPEPQLGPPMAPVPAPSR